MLHSYVVTLQMQMLLTSGSTALLTLNWLRNYGSKKNMYVDFEALRASRIWRLQKLQPKMKHSVWISWSGTDPTTELRVEKKSVCWFWTGSAIEMLLTTGTTTLFDTHALEIVNLLEPDYGTTGQKKNVCWFWSPKSKHNLATTETTTWNETLFLAQIWLQNYGSEKKCMLISKP